MRRKMCKLAVLTLMLSIPSFSNAMTYKIVSPDTQQFGKPTSDETIYVGIENKNVNRSKNSAYIPPDFGSATAYIPNRSEFLTPNIAIQSYVSNTTSSSIHTSILQTPSNQLKKEETSYTKLTSDLYYSNDRIGTLKIPELDVSVKVYEGTTDKDLEKGVGHFSISSVWNGNVVIGGHNRGVNNYFGKIHKLDIGDKITYTTKLGTRTYKVYSIEKISNTEYNKVFEKTKDNIITLITCVKNESDYRWCIKARQD